MASQSRSYATPAPYRCRRAFHSFIRTLLTPCKLVCDAGSDTLDFSMEIFFCIAGQFYCKEISFGDQKILEGIEACKYNETKEIKLWENLQTLYLYKFWNLANIFLGPRSNSFFDHNWRNYQGQLMNLARKYFVNYLETNSAVLDLSASQETPDSIK